jgi:hypothetical protein
MGDIIKRLIAYANRGQIVIPFSAHKGLYEGLSLGNIQEPLFISSMTWEIEKSKEILGKQNYRKLFMFSISIGTCGGYKNQSIGNDVRWHSRSG